MVAQQAVKNLPRSEPKFATLFHRSLLMVSVLNLFNLIDVVAGRRGRRWKQLLDYLKDRRGFCKLKEKALDRTL
jgi:hypothetical protein